MIRSKALEINLARTNVDVVIDQKYADLQEVMATYFGLLEGLNTFLKEVSHPYKNWQFIVAGARGYALEYFHLMKSHRSGPQAAALLVDIFIQALNADNKTSVKVDAADNLILFLQKIIRFAAADYPRFEPLVNASFDHLYRLDAELFHYFAHSYYSLKRLGRDLILAQPQPVPDLKAINTLLVRTMEAVCAEWLAQEDPMQWFMAEALEPPPKSVLEPIFKVISHAAFQEHRSQLSLVNSREDPSSETLLEALLEMPDHNDVQKYYRAIPQQLLDADKKSRHGHQWKLIFLFHTMNIAALAIIHEDTLRNINRTLHWLITHQSARQVQLLVQKTFSILSARVRDYPATALSCVLNIGQSIHTTTEEELFDEFISAVIDLGFQAPMISGVGNDWQTIVNAAHIQNIRTWLELVELHPKKATRLLSSLIIHIAVSGVFVRDTDLFGRDVTRLLNSDIAPVYNLTKQLARLLPVYFNDIGAEGELRDISTQIDELCHRQDPLIHFLRKQSHVEGSNRIIPLMEAALSFWETRDKKLLTEYLPPDILARVESQGPYIDGVHKTVKHLTAAGIALPLGLLSTSTEELNALFQEIPELDSVDRQRIVLFTKFYQQLNIKYNLDAANLIHFVDHLAIEAFPEINRLKSALAEADLKIKISRLLQYLDRLKEIILSSKTYEIREDIYKKRHFTVDIPSMYGSYHELKFDAMGLTLRVEALVNVLYEELVESIDLSLITKATCHEIADCLKLFNTGLIVDGIASAELAQHLDLLDHSLDIRGFSFTQYLDIFKGFSQAVRHVINDYFNNIHGEQLSSIISDLPEKQIQPKFLPLVSSNTAEPEKQIHRISEIFYRDRLATSLGLQQLDLFLSRILTTMFHQSHKLPKEELRRLLNYDPKRVVTALHRPNHLAGGIIYLGNKGLNLLKLTQLGMPVPPGFIITTEIFRCREIIESFRPARENFQEQVVQYIEEIENITGKRFGDGANPLLMSVRSGSSISQPGMLDTFLNVGINEEIAMGLAHRTDNPWFAWDSYRRFLQCYGMGLGLERDDFDAIINTFKKEVGIALKKEFSGAHMQQLALAYKSRIQDAGYTVPDDPMAQLLTTIQSVMDSWEGEKAEAYRDIMGISDDWGTAITVQAMVFGNLSRQSGAGVIFTHHPRWSGERLSLWGDFTLENQGEDVVAGLVQTMPISIRQQEMELRETDVTLESHFPEIYQTMKQWCDKLVTEEGWGPQEMEFTFESPLPQDLYLLQTRDMGIREQKQVMLFDPEHKQSGCYLAHGIGVSAGALSGRLVFSLEEVEFWRNKEPQTALILARADTVPDDIKEIHATDGLLTARGGVTSHAAVVAHRLGKTCVTGCGEMICDESEGTITFADIRLQSGDFISIDGREGAIYQGAIKIKTT